MPRRLVRQPGVVQTCVECQMGQAEFEGRGQYAGFTYCGECWNSWIVALNSTQCPWSAVPWVVAKPVLPRGGVDAGVPVSSRQHYDFIEVGSSDWGTLSQYCAGQAGHQGSWLAADIRTSLNDLRWVRGLVVEPVCEHLQALPNLPRVTKVQAAMDEESGEETLHCVSAENIQRYMGRYHAELPDYPSSPVDVMWYAKSLSCIGRPHPDLTPMLAKIGRCDLLEKRIVRVLSWAELCELHGVGSVDTVQLDCEGRDCAILRGVLSHCDKDPTALPRVIQFEANHLTDDLEIAETVDALKAHGYKIRAQNGRNILVDR